jgi:hypothetical protein
MMRVVVCGQDLGVLLMMIAVSLSMWSTGSGDDPRICLEIDPRIPRNVADLLMLFPSYRLLYRLRVGA